MIPWLKCESERGGAVLAVDKFGRLVGGRPGGRIALDGEFDVEELVDIAEWVRSHSGVTFGQGER